MSDKPEPPEKPSLLDTIFDLPPVSDYEGINRNFASVMKLFSEFAKQVKEHADNTDENMEQIFKEVRDGFQKVGEDFKSVLSMQTNFIILAVIGISTALKVVGTIIEFAAKHI